MLRGDLYNLSVSSPFMKDINHLPSVRLAIETQFSKMDWTDHEPCIYSITMRAATAFTVQFNQNTIITAELTPSADYRLCFRGTIAHIVFTDDTTLTFFQVEWSQDRKNHNVPTFDAVEDTVITITDAHSNDIPPSDTNEYELSEAWYTLTADHANYNTVTYKYLYRLEDTVKVPTQVPTEYIVTFDVMPEDASVEVKDVDENVITPTANPLVYILANSVVAGNYSYTVSATGYVNSTETLTVLADVTVTVTLEEWLSSIAITTPPTKIAYAIDEVFDPAGMVITAAYQDESTEAVENYAWEPDGALTAEDTEITISYTEDGIIKTATQAITVT